MRDAERGTSLRFVWEQAATRYRVEVWGPLGQGRTQLLGDPGNMRITRGVELLAEGDPKAIMQAQLGWQVPMGFLPAWIRGEPFASEPFVDGQRDGANRFARFQQAGWAVELNDYEKRASNDATPTRIVATRGPRKITVVVREFADFAP